MRSRIKKAFSAIDFPLESKKSNISEITLTGRYPEKGSALNTKSEMVVYVLKGTVVFNQGNMQTTLTRGSVVLVKAKQKYFWEPKKKATVLVISTPLWTATQQRIV